MNRQYAKLKFIRKECATVEEFDFLLAKWPQKKYSSYPILYLAFHGEPGNIILSNERKRSLEDISSIISDSCANRVIIFSSCKTLKINEELISKFIEETGALAVIGYKSDVDWIKSVALDLLLIDTLQNYEFSGRGLKGIETCVRNLAKQFSDLGLHMLTKAPNKATQRIP